MQSHTTLQSNSIRLLVSADWKPSAALFFYKNNLNHNFKHTFIHLLYVHVYIYIYIYYCGPRLFSRYSDTLRAGWCGDRIPLGASFSAPVQTGPVAHKGSYTTGIGSFPGVKWVGVDHPPHLSPRLKKELSRNSTTPPGLRGLFYGELYLYLHL